MTLFRSGRFLFWLARELVDKYKKALSLGVFIGVFVFVIFWKLSPFISTTWFSAIDRIGVIGDFTPSTLPPAIAREISSGLTTISTDGGVLPGLAETWESTDSGKTYIFSLQRNIRWHSGETVKAQDVNYNIRDVSFVAVDDHTLKATLIEPFSPFPALVAKPILQRGLSGFGPFRVVNIKLKGDIIQYMRLIPFEEKSKKRSIEYRFYRTEAQVIAAYKLGDIDKIVDLTSPGELGQWKNTKVEKFTRYDQIVTLFFNLKDPLLSEKGVRQALGYALPNADEERAYSPISRTSWAYTDKVRRFDTNNSQAEKTLMSANIDLTNKEITITTFPRYLQTSQRVAEKWQELGVKVKVKLENVLPSDFQILLSGQSIPPDPDQYPFWHSTQRGTNITSYTNVKIDKILEDARKEPDITKRKKLYGDFQRFLVEDAPALFYYYPNRYTVTRN